VASQSPLHRRSARSNAPSSLSRIVTTCTNRRSLDIARDLRLHSVLHPFNAKCGRTTNVGLESSTGIQLDGARVAFLVAEFDQGGSDLNGDGDADDLVLPVVSGP
jgi:hypothetical protein